MSIWSDVGARFRSLWSREEEEAELDEELRFHIDMETRKHIRAGLMPAAARRRALLAFGGVDRVGEQVRDARGVRALEDVLRDVRQAARALARRPVFTVVAVATLAIGIGASTAMFSLVDVVLLRPLPYAQPERLVSVAEVTAQGGLNVTSPYNVTQWREQSGTLAAIATWVDRPFNVTGEEPAVVAGRWASDNYFGVLGVRPLLGRLFVSGDEDQDLAVLSHRLWQSRFGGDPSVIGATIEIGYLTRTIIGVLPPQLPAPQHLLSDTGEPDIFLPHAGLAPDFRGRFLSAAARLAPGATLDDARAELAVIATRLATEEPGYYGEMGVRMQPLQAQMTGAARGTLLVLLGAVALLLLIACANVASLFLGRAATRRRELALRRSLGAGRGRLLAHVLTEALVVAGAAGLLGVLLAHVAMRTAVAALPATLALPRLADVAVDWRVLGFALFVTLLTGLLFGAAPALAGARVEPAHTLREASRGSTSARTRLRSALIVGQVALALVLLAGAGLLVRTVHNLLNVDTGVRAEGVLTMRMTLSTLRYPDDERRRVFVGELLEQLRATPGVQSAGTIAWLPLGGAKSRTSFRRDELPPPPEGQWPAADIRVVAGDYFAALGVPLLRGRFFDATDRADAPIRYIINDALARQHFPGEDPIGRRISYEWDQSISGEIIGVVGSVREDALDVEPATAIYRPFAQDPWNLVTVVVRVDGDAAALAPAIVQAARAVDATLPVADVRTFASVMAGTIARQRLGMLLLAGFAAVALLLVVIGMYGVIAYSVTQRTRELGVRIALGAQRGDVLRLVVGYGLVLTVLGLLIGAAASLALGRVMSGLLFGVTPADALTLAGAALIIGATALIASWLPARRATRIDPVEVLAAEG
jgi:putative ABC transport system permease protein